LAQLTVFVTGAGALLGQGILRSLRASRLDLRIITGDPDPRAAGHWLGDVALLIPPAADPAYVARIEEIIAAERVALVLVGTDVELPALAGARRELEARHRVRVVVSPPNVVEIADDKWLTARFFEDAGLPFARSALVSEPDSVRRLVADLGLPLFAKPRRGARSIGARVLRNSRDVEQALAEPGLVIQELLPEHGGEYTAGCLVLRGRCEGVVVLRRDLRDGNTYRAYSDEEYDRFIPFVTRAAEALGPDGPCNLQFRIRDHEPVVFEINGRFSGTTPIRALFGFNEVEHLIRHLIHGVPIPPVELRRGLVLRATSDLYIGQSVFDELRASGRLEAPAADPLAFLNERLR
jgi:carbamoyl-phosphate synthase large subunit